jgi:hypothetical protein
MIWLQADTANVRFAYAVASEFSRNLERDTGEHAEQARSKRGTRPVEIQRQGAEQKERVFVSAADQNGHDESRDRRHTSWGIAL